jgi:hypothetical protein
VNKVLPARAVTGLALSLVFSIVCLFASVGCHKTLEPGGAYSPSITNATTGAVTSSPDMAFYTVDSAFYLAYTSLDTVFAIERDNRAALFKLSPAIKHTLDSIRPTALAVAQEYARARTAYIANPTPAGLTGLQLYLARIQQLVVSAQAALPTTGVATNAPSARLNPPMKNLIALQH